MSVAKGRIEGQPTPGGSEQDEFAFWERWRSHGDEAARSRLLDMHLPYARVVAATYFRRRFHDEIEFDEYLQLATVGLMEAMERFDPAGGAQFRTFAARRMHGAILDGLEHTTEKQQQIAARQRLEAQRRASVERMAAEADSSGARGPGKRTAEQLLQYVADAGLAFALEWILDGTGMIAAGEGSEAVPFYRRAELRELRQRILDLVKSLPAQERRVIQSHYLQEQTFEEISSLLGVGKSRVSQLHRQALTRLKEMMRSPPSCDLSL